MAKNFGGVKAIHDWHGEIEDDEIGFELMCFNDGLAAVLRSPHTTDAKELSNSSRTAERTAA